MESPLRVQARQARSVATFERIVTAAGELFDEVGPENTSTEAIAARAGVSIGSVYRFFENRAAIESVIAERSLERAIPPMEAMYSDESLQRDLEDVCESFIEVLRGVFTSIPGSRVLLSRMIVTPNAERVAHFTALLERPIERYAPGLPAARRRAAARTYATFSAALMAAAGAPGEDPEAHLTELRDVLVGYMRQLQLHVRAT